VGHHAPGTILESNELGAALDLDAERGQPIALPPPLPGDSSIAVTVSTRGAVYPGA